MEKTRDELVQDMIKNIQDQKQDQYLQEVAIPGIVLNVDKSTVKRKEEG